jgi:putative ABC transport system substrate-binding protein
MRRRDFIGLLAGAGAAPALLWPRPARAQQPALPVIGFLNAQSIEAFIEPLRGFRQSLKEAGFMEGENVAVEYRWAENETERLPALAADLVRRRVAVIAAFGSLTSLQAKAATTTIPIVFNIGDDPVKVGLVASLAQPGGNLTGVNFLTAELTAKRLELLRELVPGATRIAVLINPADGPVTEAALADVAAAARAMGLQIQVFSANSSADINAAFATFAHDRPDALFVGPGAFFTARRVQLAQLAARHALPATYPRRDIAEVGGLMSYGATLDGAWRQVGLYIGRILRGAKPAELPVVQSSTFELVINAETARMLGLAVPPQLLARADAVIE